MFLLMLRINNEKFWSDNKVQNTSVYYKIIWMRRPVCFLLDQTLNYTKILLRSHENNFKYFTDQIFHRFETSFLYKSSKFDERNPYILFF